MAAITNIIRTITAALFPAPAPRFALVVDGEVVGVCSSREEAAYYRSQFIGRAWVGTANVVEVR